jgi:hypothetical protein
MFNFISGYAWRLTPIYVKICRHTLKAAWYVVVQICILVSQGPRDMFLMNGCLVLYATAGSGCCSLCLLTMLQLWYSGSFAAERSSLLLNFCMLFFLKLRPAISGLDTRRYVPAFRLFVNWIGRPYMLLVFFIFFGIACVINTVVPFVCSVFADSA